MDPFDDSREHGAGSKNSGSLLPALCLFVGVSFLSRAVIIRLAVCKHSKHAIFEPVAEHQDAQGILKTVEQEATEETENSLSPLSLLTPVQKCELQFEGLVWLSVNGNRR
jgi:hypothetical protein